MQTTKRRETEIRLAQLEEQIRCVRANFNFISDDDLIDSCIFYLKALESERRCLQRTQEV